MKHFFLCLSLSCLFSSFAFSNPRKIIECTDGGFDHKSLEVYDDGRSYLFKLNVGPLGKHFHLTPQSIEKGSYEFELSKDKCRFPGGVLTCTHYSDGSIILKLRDEWDGDPDSEGAEHIEMDFLTFDLSPAKVKRPISHNPNKAETRNIRIAGLYGRKAGGDGTISAQIDFEKKYCTAVIRP